MVIQYCSDLHLEFSSNWKWIQNNPIEPVGDILLVAGDIYYLGEEYTNHPWFDYASRHWEYVYLIPGNHEFYGGYDAEICLERDYEVKVRENVFLLNNTVREIEGTRFIFSCMWSRIEKQVGPILGGVNDFRLINFNGSRLTVNDFNQMFETAWSFLQKEINHRATNNVVVTHHLPSNQCNLPIYKNSKINEAFCIDLTAEIETSNVQYWIYGHSHGNVPNFKIGDTSLHTNQLGYVDAGEAATYIANAVFTI